MRPPTDEATQRALPPHLLPTLAYRTRKAVRDAPPGVTVEQLLQGPFADAMTHAGQLALLSRLHGSPIPPENFVMADLDPEHTEWTA